MSWQAVKWAIHDAPVDDAAVLMVLIAICERADAEGRNAYPSMTWVADRARCSVRTAHRRLAVLRKEGLVLEGDQSLVAGFRADRRPSVFDVDMTRLRDVSDPTPRESGWDDSTRSRPDTDDMTNLTRRDTDDMSQASRRDVDDMSSEAAREPRHDRSGSHGMSPVADNKPIPPTEVNPKERDAASQATLVDVDANPKPINGRRQPKRPEWLDDPTQPTFDDFWRVYPLRKEKAGATRAWQKAIQVASPATIVAGVDAYKVELARTRVYCKHPATWLNAHCWDDLPTPDEMLHDRVQPSRPVQPPPPGSGVWGRTVDLDNLGDKP